MSRHLLRRVNLFTNYSVLNQLKSHSCTLKLPIKIITYELYRWLLYISNSKLCKTNINLFKALNQSY